MGSVADSWDLWDRNPLCFSGCCGPHPLNVRGLTLAVLLFLSNCFCQSDLHLITFLFLFNHLLCLCVCTGFSSCAICLSTWPVLFRRCSVPPTGDLASSSITGKSSYHPELCNEENPANFIETLPCNTSYVCPVGPCPSWGWVYVSLSCSSPPGTMLWLPLW